MKKSFVFGLALCLTLCLSLMSYTSSAQRGGILWGVVSVLCVISLHLLPAITSGRVWGIRAIGGLVFALLFCIVATQHASFFLQQESEKGQQRARAIAQQPPLVLSRNSATVAHDLAIAVAATRWLKNGALQRQNRIVDALRTELSAVQQLEAQDLQQREKQQQQRDNVSTEPLYLTITKVMGLDGVSVSLALNVTTALSLELLTSLLWFVALQQSAKREWWMLPAVPKKAAAGGFVGFVGTLLPHFQKKTTATKPASKPVTVAPTPTPEAVKSEEQPSLDDAARLLSWLRKRGEPVTLRQCLSSSPIRKKERLQPLLNDLVSRGLARLDGGMLVA